MANAKVAQATVLHTPLLSRSRAYLDGRVGATQGSSHSPSLLFELEEDDAPKLSLKVDIGRLHDTCQRVKHFSEPTGQFARKLLRDVKAFKQAVILEEDKSDTVVLATKLANVGYTVSLRKALGGAAGTSCFSNLRHEFLVVTGSGDFQGIHYIVEPHFRQHFEITHPTEAYLQVLDEVPQEYVGTAARLIPVVQAVCGAMIASFDAKGLTLPPWRRTQSMLSKWLPSKASDRAFTSEQSAAVTSATQLCLSRQLSSEGKARSLLSTTMATIPAPNFVVKAPTYPGQPPTCSVKLPR